jgi:glycerate dehydrogenase
MAAPTIVVLDGHTLNPGDIDWKPVESLGRLTVYDRSGDKIVDRARDAQIVLTNKDPITADSLQQLPELRYIGVLATGTNIVDLQAARQREICVTNVPGYGAGSVAQHAFALLLELVNHTSRHLQAVRDGAWSSCPDFSFTVDTMYELAGKTMGIVGVGAIGRRVARISRAMGMDVAAAYQPDMEGVHMSEVPIHWMPVDELFSAADVVTLHCPLTDETRHLVSAERLELMKPTAYLINTGRGPLVDEAALHRALVDGRIAGAALDVLGVEPPAADHPLMGAPRCIVTPHIAWATKEARERLMSIAADNIAAFLRGTPKNVVN